MNKSVFSIRKAKKEDSALIIKFIKELAEYEKMVDRVVATEEIVEEWIFDKQTAEVFFPMVDGKEIGYALIFTNFSTFQGRAGLYLEDLYIQQEYRGNGYGTAVLKFLAQNAIERGLGRMEWVCLDWNQKSIDIYLSLGAKPMDEWTIYRLEGETLKTMAEA